MRLPEIALRLRELAESLSCPELDALADEMGRRRVAPRSAVKSVRINDEIRDKIMAIHKENPNLSQQEIAGQLGINPGRVSETLHGKRK